MIQTERLTIRLIEEGDWRDMQKIWISFACSEYSCYDAPNKTDNEAVEQRIRRWAMINRGAFPARYYGVVKDDTVIGFVSVQTEQQRGEIGYAFRGDMHGKGYAKEAIGALMQYLHETGGINIFMVGTGLANTPSVRLLSSLGFTRIAEEMVSFYQDENGEKIWFEGGIFGKTME